MYTGHFKQHNSQAFVSSSISMNPTVKRTSDIFCSQSSINSFQKQNKSRIQPMVSKIAMKAEITLDCNLEHVVPKARMAKIGESNYRNQIKSKPGMIEKSIEESKLKNLEKSFALPTKENAVAKTPKAKP